MTEENKEYELDSIYDMKNIYDEMKESILVKEPIFKAPSELEATMKRGNNPKISLVRS